MNRRWVLTAPRQMELQTFAAPEPAPDEVTVRTEISAVSAGSELHAYRTGPSAFMESPGYLTVGTITAKGSQAQSLQLGDRVFVPAPHGGLTTMPAHRAVPVPPELPSEEAVLTYLASLGLYCLHAGTYQAGENVAVIGLGVVGVCAALVAALAGARVHAVDTDDARLGLAAELGLHTWNARPADLQDEILSASPQGIDLVVETSGVWAGLDTAARLCRSGSRICVLGVYRDPPSRETGTALHERLLSFPARFHYENLRLIGCANHPWEGPGSQITRWSVQRALHYLMECQVDERLALSPVITHRIPPEGLPDLYHRLDTGDRSILAAVIHWP
ncbi:zinc-dependent alcohol dehydrogenase [Actinomadura rubrisoli]|uniref:Zinc-binding alcohol dehydrogenase n=1 Tax=Actinomadura rubrisoli TaxID=2530368 RepID=A0A4R5C9A0_9ACTN|nr:zinc-binding alcohol dehydrogenase [Actinomadura rubrisoli]TDD96431.1 zinc-binding alcohol dehydrogenase [Actinomadura rubrisoli]